MDIEEWLRIAMADAERRGLPELKPLLQGLARATEALRRADFEHATTNDRPTPLNNR